MHLLKGSACVLCATFVALAATRPLPAQTPTLARKAPVIDGSDNDDVWRSTTPIAAFRVFDPTEDGDPAFRTEARLAYDARNLYVFVRAYDPHPDSVVALLSRRDVRTTSDQLKIMVDSYFDHRTGYEFAVNPAGVKRDYYIFDDTREDISWDAVWDVATKIDSVGWSAEFQIPLSQLRYTTSDANTMGVMIMRDVARTNERYSWPVYRRSRPGTVSQFARVDGFRGLSSPRHIELLPYALSRNEPATDGRTQQQQLGGDARVGLGPNLTLTAAVNPDFGQVEADPAVLNLSAFEVSFDELRPFFVEGSGFLGRNQMLFYSRRIGAGGTRIDAATKLTGRLPGAYTVGALAAYADHQLYTVGRVAKDLRGGNSGISLLATAVRRDLDAASTPVLRREAVTGALNARHRFLNNTYEARAALYGSSVQGSTAAIARTQRTAVHFYQRPDSPLNFDSTRTSLTGTYLDASVMKVAGVLQYGVDYQRISPGFETNDMGFLSQADIQYLVAQGSLTSRKPHAFWNNAQVAVIGQFSYATDGLPTGNYVELDGFAQFKNNATASVSMWTDNVTPTYCDRCARGGPALRLSADHNILINLQGDTRRKVAPYFAAIYTIGDGGRSQLWRIRPLVAVRNGARLNWEFASRYQKNMDNTQWVANAGTVGADSSHYIFGHLNQDLLSFSARLNYTLTPTLSLQYYAEPFVSTGHYTNLRELSATPRAANYDARFRPTTAQPGSADFNVKQFNSSAVVRWEYRPGSTLYVVWQQGREQYDRNLGDFRATRDYADLFGTLPNNTFLIKASYWLNL